MQLEKGRTSHYETKVKSEEIQGHFFSPRGYEDIT